MGICNMSDKTEFVGGYVKPKLKRELQKIAQEEDRSVNWVIEKILETGVKHRAQRVDKEKAETTA